MHNHPPLVSRQLARAWFITWLGLFVFAAASSTTASALAQDRSQGHVVVDAVLCATHCEGMVLRVWDGDSFRIGYGPESERVRLEHIDAPEIEGRCPFEIQLAQRSKLRLADLLRDRDITITRSGQDLHGRTLASLSVAGVDIGDILIREGLARTWNGHRTPWCPGRRIAR